MEAPTSMRGAVRDEDSNESAFRCTVPSASASASALRRPSFNGGSYILYQRQATSSSSITTAATTVGSFHHRVYEVFRHLSIKSEKFSSSSHHDRLGWSTTSKSLGGRVDSHWPTRAMLIVDQDFHHRDRLQASSVGPK
nr:hypothetical protein CFP56_69082 [Quercus suber]